MNTADEKAIAEAATPGPWTRGEGTSRWAIRGQTAVIEAQRMVCDTRGSARDANADAICHARFGYPLALAVVETLQVWRRLSIHDPNRYDAWLAALAALDAWEAAQ